jgi:rhodanese-related sulfurtransferase
MRPIALAGSWLQIVATLVLFLAVVMRAGAPVSPYKSHDVSVPEVISLIESGALVIDVRYSPTTQLPGAMLIPMEVLAARLEKLEIAKTQPIVVYCGNGSARGPEASQILTRAGFTNVVNLGGGIDSWRAAGLPVTAG